MDLKDRARRIKAILAANGVRQVDIARKVGVSRGHVNNVINGIDRSQRVIDALVEAGVPRDYFGENDE